MRIFTEEDVGHLKELVVHRIREDKEMFFSYFEYIATERYFEYFLTNKESIMSCIDSEIRRQSPNALIRVPLVTFTTFKETAPKYRQTRRRLQEEQLHSNCYPQCYFHSMSGIHITDLASIYRHSNFRRALNESMGSEGITVSLNSVYLAEVDGVKRYTNTLWIRYNPKCTSSSKSRPVSV